MNRAQAADRHTTDHVSFGEYAVLGRNVTFGHNVTIGHHVVIYDDTVIGDNVTIQDHAVIGKQPTKAKHSILKQTSALPPAVIGDGCIIGTSSIVYAGTKLERDVFVADLATIRERVAIGSGTIIGRGASVENDCTVGARCKLETNCYITAYSVLGDYVFIAPCVVTSNDNYMGRTKERFAKMKGVTVKNGGRIGAGAITLPGIVIEEDGTVGAGSVVTRDVISRELVAGIPARKFRNVPEEQLLENQ
ncbi:N-acetyltransferase [Paenibacillus contaminans]|uniref:N-acetyltransferase n=1 Tax=Paenibacillus contaminans TaxID=450362 RepID=A0A329MRY7_9BACL|nr:acyltransferase [Paenibacillus contaminans]RAV22116.1 N-acetyltransferase [Paenibacillus contaminans]